MKILSSPENKQVNTGEMYFGWVLINNHTPQSLYEIILCEYSQFIKKEVYLHYKKRALTKDMRVLRSTIKKEVFADYKKESVYLVLGSFPSL